MGIRGKMKLVVDNYTYYRFSKARQTQTWFCSQRKTKNCRASLKLHHNGSMKKIIAAHSHGHVQIPGPIVKLQNFADLYDSV